MVPSSQAAALGPQAAHGATALDPNSGHLWLVRGSAHGLRPWKRALLATRAEHNDIGRRGPLARLARRTQSALGGRTTSALVPRFSCKGNRGVLGGDSECTPSLLATPHRHRSARAYIRSPRGDPRLPANFPTPPTTPPVLTGVGIGMERLGTEVELGGSYGPC